MLVNSVIAIGPSLNFYPLTPPDHPKFMLPFLNENMLLYTIRYLEPCSSKIFIFCIEEYEKMIRALIVNVKCNIEIIATNGYEGMGFVLCMIRNRLTSDVFILCKADMIFRESLPAMISRFQRYPKDDMHGSFFVTGEKESCIVILDNGRIVAYNRNYMPLTISKITVTTKFRLKNFFIIRSRMLERVRLTDFGFKRCIVPWIIRKNRFFKVFYDENEVIYNINDYIAKQFEHKKLYLPGSPDTLLGNGTDVHTSCRMKNNIIGHNCVIEKDCSVTDSIFMDNVKIGAGSVICGCVIGARTAIPPGSQLLNVMISNDYVFNSRVEESNNRLGYD